MSGMNHITNSKEFERFHKALTSEQLGYTPWYFLLSKGLKDPVKGISWKQLEGRLTFEQALKKMRAGHNIGIAATGMDALCIVDVDDIEATPDELVKPTLSTRSRKRIGRHYFYTTNDPRCKENLPTESKGEIRSSFEYVVAPGSYVLCDDKTIAAMPEAERELAGRYTVENERAPSTITFEELPPVFLEQAKKNHEAEKEAKKKREEKAKARKDKKPAQGSDKNKSAIWDLSIDDIVSIPNKARFTSLFHESTTGKNTALNDNGGLTCWRHLVTHTPLSALAVLAGVADCNSAGQGVNRDNASCIDYEDGRTLFALWAFAKREGMTPKDDPIPAAALRWYAVENGLCKQEEITDGWKLPTEAYNQAIALFESEEKLSTGRQRIKPKTVASPEAAGTGALVAMGEALDKKLDSIDIAEAMQRTNPIIYDKTKQFWIWDGIRTMWFMVDETDVFNTLRKVAGLRGGVVGSARSTYLQAIKLTGREFEVKEPEDRWVAFADCVIDLKTGDRFKATKEYMFTNTIPHKYGDSIETPTIDRLFTEWVGEEWAELLYEIVAYCLYNRYPIHRAFLLFGSGRNGKGQYLTLVQRFLGLDNTVATDLNRLVESRFEAAKLHHKKAAVMGETEFKEMNKTSMFKHLTGEDLIPGERKYGVPYDFINHAKLLIGSNSIPPSNDKSEGYGSRWVIIDFPNKFEISKPVVDTIPEREYENLCRKSVEKLRDLLERGVFYREGSTTARAQRYEEKSNPIQMFISARCDVGGDLSVPLWRFVEAYEVYQAENRLRKLTKKTIKAWLSNQGYEMENENITDEEGRHFWVIIYGVDLRCACVTCESCQISTDFPCKGLVENTHDSHVTHVKTCGGCSKPPSGETFLGKSGQGSIRADRTSGLGEPTEEELNTLITEAIAKAGRDGENHEFTVSEVLIKYLPRKQGFTTEMIERFVVDHADDLEIKRMGGGRWRQVSA